MPKAKAKKKARRAWTKDEVKLLKELYPDGRAEEIAERTGRPVTSVRRRAYYMGIQAGEYRLWSANEVQLLKRLYPSENPQSIADKLGRAVGAITAKAYRMGLTGESRVWSKRELNVLKRLYPSKTAQQIAEQLGRSVRATRFRILKLGLQKRFRYDDCHRVVNGTKERLCRKCKRWKNESDFYKNRATKDGLDDRCKTCSCKAASKSYERKRTDVRRNLRYEECHRVVNGVRQKLCNKCRRWQKEGGFYKNRAAMGGLTLHQAVSLVVTLCFLPVLPLHIHLARGTFAVALMSIFLEPKEKVLRRARDLRGTDGDGVWIVDRVRELRAADCALLVLVVGATLFPKP